MFSKPLHKRQKSVLARIVNWRGFAARLDRDVYYWLKRHGSGYSTRTWLFDAHQSHPARGEIRGSVNCLRSGGPDRTRICDLLRVKQAL
jgi:hypothetical protein